MVFCAAAIENLLLKRPEILTSFCATDVMITLSGFPAARKWFTIGFGAGFSFLSAHYDLLLHSSLAVITNSRAKVVTMTLCGFRFRSQTIEFHSQNKTIAAAGWRRKGLSGIGRIE